VTSETDGHVPYLSVVVTTRNDDHGGDPLKRLRAFVNTFDAHCRLTGLDAEVIVVEWNPPVDRARVQTLLRLPERHACVYRFIEVPRELHQRLRYADVLPLFQMIAKNVGIRRARGRFVLATNIDIIFSSELVAFLGCRQLQTGVLYRVDRHDIEPALPIDASVDEQMAYCAEHQLRVHERGGTQIVDRFGRPAALEQDVVSGPVVTLGRGWFSREGDSRFGFVRWAADEALLHIDRRAAAGLSRGAVLELELEPNPYQTESWVELEVLDGSRRLARPRLHQLTRLCVLLEDGRVSHEIALKVADVASGGRHSLPLLERREGLLYRMRSARVRVIQQLAETVHDLGNSWRRANPNPALSVEHTPEGVVVAINGRSLEYCVERGPFHVRTSGTYHFLLEYSPVVGGLDLSLRDRAFDRWCPSERVEIHHDDDRRTVILSCELQRGQHVTLLVSSLFGPGETVGRFVLRRLHSSASIAELSPHLSPARLRHSIRGLAVRVLRAWYGGAKRCSRAMIALIRGIGARVGVVDVESPEAKDLQAQPAARVDSSELAGLARFLREYRPSNLHQNGCGDFQLMAREHWRALRGYPEFHLFSMNIDGLLSASAHAAGIREQRLDAPLCVYHLEHEKGSGWTPEGEAALRRRIAESGISWLENEAVHVMSAYMEWLGRPMIFNDEAWGFGNDVLPETVNGNVNRLGMADGSHGSDG
jgi:hypothetical protein